MAKVLPVAEKRLIEQLLEMQSRQFFQGSECLNQISDRFDAGDSSYFLRLLSIELTFKLIYLRETDSLIFGHDLREIFDVMPRISRERIFALFAEQLRKKIKLDEFRGWLKYLGELFVKIRYPFDEFREMPIEEYEAKVRRFEEAAADDLSDASIVYHTDRVEALVAALQAYVSGHA
jgi:hypothetical protein